MTYQYRISSHAVSAAISAWLTASHPNSEVKQVRAGVVLRWGTTREGPVLRFLFLFVFLNPFPFYLCHTTQFAPHARVYLVEGKRKKAKEEGRTRREDNDVHCGISE